MSNENINQEMERVNDTDIIMARIIGLESKVNQLLPLIELINQHAEIINGLIDRMGKVDEWCPGRKLICK